jgi:hypothetical protein
MPCPFTLPRGTWVQCARSSRGPGTSASRALAGSAGRGPHQDSDVRRRARRRLGRRHLSRAGSLRMPRRRCITGGRIRYPQVRASRRIRPTDPRQRTRRMGAEPRLADSPLGRRPPAVLGPLGARPTEAPRPVPGKGWRLRPPTLRRLRNRAMAWPRPPSRRTMAVRGTATSARPRSPTHRDAPPATVTADRVALHSRGGDAWRESFWSTARSAAPGFGSR